MIYLRETFEYQLVESCAAQFADAFFNGILVFGAKKRNSSAILIWIVLAFIKLIYTTIATLLLIFKIHHHLFIFRKHSYYDRQLPSLYIILGIAVTTILLYTRERAAFGGLLLALRGWEV